VSYLVSHVSGCGKTGFCKSAKVFPTKISSKVESFLLGNKPAIQYLVEITEERSQISLDRNNLANSTLKSGMVEVVEGSNKYGM